MLSPKASVRKLRRWNLNLLPVLRELLRTRSVTRAGENLAIGQPAASAALSRLRQLLDDDLLIMVGRELRLTPRAEALVEPLERLLSETEHLLGLDRFDPARSDRRFVIATADYVGLMIGSALLRGIQEQAPAVSIQFIEIPLDIGARLRNGGVDVLISPDIGVTQSKQICTSKLFRDEMVCIVAADHPEVGDTLSLETYLRLPHVRFQINQQSILSAEQQVLERHRIQQKDAAIIPNFLLMPAFVQGTRNVALVHASLARVLARAMDIRILPPPFACPPVAVDMFWHVSQDLDAGSAWFRKQLLSAAAQIPPPPSP